MPPKSTHPRKKAKTTTSGKSVSTSTAFGAPTDDDDPSTRHFAPSSSAYSSRTLPDTSVPTLVALCIRVFALNIQKLSRKEDIWEGIRQYLKILPEVLLTRTFATLKTTCPNILNAPFITTFFFTGSVMILTNDLPGVKKQTITDIQRMGNRLQELELTGFDKYPDIVFASLLPNIPSLTSLVLRGCQKVGTATVHAAAKSCKLLRMVNLNYTSTSPVALLPLIQSCGTHLEVLKVAGIPNWTDASFTKLLAGLDDAITLPSLRTLKLRGSSLSDASLNAIISLCPALQRLDASFTLIRHPSILSDPVKAPSLEKLSLTSTPVTGIDLIAILKHQPLLKTLALGALGGGQVNAATMGNSSAMTMSDQTLAELTDTIADYSRLENISLVGNVKLGTTGRHNRALGVFVRRVGRRCKKLNLAGLTHLQSSDMAGLIPEDDDDPSPLAILNLNSTGIDDESSVYVSTCSQLRTLEVQGTKFTSEGLFTIIDACTNLDRLDLTSCRGISVVDRRRFFEVWEAAKQEG